MTETMTDALERALEALGEAYQVVGAIARYAGIFETTDVQRALDNISAAANGEPVPHTDLLPWPKEELRPTNAPSNEELETLIKPIWLKVKPSREAQAIRASLSVEFDDPQYQQWVSDAIPDYVWNLVDIAAQRGKDEGRKEERELLEDPPTAVIARGVKMLNTPRGGDDETLVHDIWQAMLDELRSLSEQNNPET